MSTTKEDRAYLSFLKEKLEKKYTYEDISYELTVRRSRKNDRFGIQDVLVNMEFSSKNKDYELFKTAIAIESALLRAIHNMIKSLTPKEANITLSFPTILLPGLSHPAIRIGGRYLTDSSLAVKCESYLLILQSVE